MLNYAAEAISILTNGNLLITNEAIQKIVASIIAKSDKAAEGNVKGSWYKSYWQERCFENRFSKYENDPFTNITTDYGNPDIEQNSVAFYYVEDLITYDSYWFFSTRQFVEDFRAAEANPRITSHLILTNSGGGQAYYLDVVAATLRAATKPVFNHIEEGCASAAYYLGANTHMYGTTAFDSVGSIGVMVSGLDLIPYFEKLGAKYYEIYADASSLKNHTSRELSKGNERPIIDEVLNPYCDSFVAAVKAARPSLDKRPAEEGIFNGKIFFGSQAKTLGLIDGIQTFDETIAMAVAAGKSRKATYTLI